MLRKSILAVAATAALGLAALSPTSAFAGGGGGHGGWHGGHGGHWGGHPHWHVGYYPRPIWVAPRPVYVAARPVAVAANPCTCLSKEYTPEGAVLCKDLCTKEAAMNPPVIAPRQSSSIDPPIQQAASSPQYQETPDNALAQVDPTTGLPK